MTPKEQEIAIGELEERVDRLRALYEQYFLGFEKLEPSVPRKDVDRRFAILRKQQIRNTALRFRFNVLTQKFNTYQMYWVRICRQIEEGTFKRHVRRANERFGKQRGGEAPDISIDVDLADFELDADMDAALAEANAAAAAYAETKHDTEPPPRPAPQPARRSAAITVQEDTLAELDALAAAAKAELPLRVAGPGAGSSAWVNMTRQRESLDDAPTSEPPRGPPPSDPHVRTASLPAGAKPRILRKIGGESQPAGATRAPDAQPARIIRVGNPGGTQQPGPSNSSGRLPAAAPAHSSGRLPVAPPASSSPIVSANPRPPQGSQPHLPPMRAPQGSQPYVPPPARPPQGSQPQLPPPAARPPQAPPNPQNLPPMRPPQGTQPNLPPMRPAQGTQPNLPPMRPPQGSQPNAPPMRPRTPSIVDGDAPVSRPRIQLPSQITKAAPKKEGEE